MRETSQQKDMENSAKQLLNVEGAFEVDPSARQARPGAPRRRHRRLSLDDDRSRPSVAARGRRGRPSARARLLRHRGQLSGPIYRRCSSRSLPATSRGDLPALKSRDLWTILQSAADQGTTPGALFEAEDGWNSAVAPELRDRRCGEARSSGTGSRTMSMSSAGVAFGYPVRSRTRGQCG